MRKLQRIDGGGTTKPIHIIDVQSCTTRYMQSVNQGGVIVQGEKDYEKLDNKPHIESIELIGDKTFEELGLIPISNIELSNLLK